MTTQYIETPGGDRLAVIPEAEYNALHALQVAMEDADDANAARAILDDLKNGKEELIPGHTAERLIAGAEHPLRIWRDHRGMKAKDLAAAADITAVYLSEIEHGKKDGSLQVLCKLARVLKVRLDDLVPDNIG